MYIVRNQTHKTHTRLMAGIGSIAVAGYEEHFDSAFNCSVQNKVQGEWPEVGFTLYFSLLLQTIMAKTSQTECHSSTAMGFFVL